MSRIGKFTVFYGSMFSEKSGDMISLCLKAQRFQHKVVSFFKPVVDTRSAAEVVSRIGLSAKAEMLGTNAAALLDEYGQFGTLGGIDVSNVDIIAFDEVQFYSKEIVALIKKLLADGHDVMAAGLSLDYLGAPIGSVSELVMIADEAVKKTAYCSVCGQPALFSQRMVNGREFFEAAENMVCIGDAEAYEPRCREHYISPNN